jgi:hypothetical protein
LQVNSVPEQMDSVAYRCLMTYLPIWSPKSMQLMNSTAAPILIFLWQCPLSKRNKTKMTKSKKLYESMLPMTDSEQWHLGTSLCTHWQKNHRTYKSPNADHRMVSLKSTTPRSHTNH